ncbi:MAG: LppX_LprAFG lipoprotein [Actinomycetota bacterium]
MTIANSQLPCRNSGRRPAGIAVGAAALALLAACSGSGSTGQASTGQASTGGSQAGGGSSLSAAQAVRLAAQQGKKVRSYSIKLDTSATGDLAAHTSGTVQLRVKPALLAGIDLNIDTSGTQQSLQEVLTPKAIYVKLPGVGNPSKPWIKVSLTGSGGTGATLGQLLQSVESSNPENQTRMLTASKDLRKTGTQVIDGVPTTRYTGSYPLAAALRQLPPSLRKLTGAAIEGLGVTTVHFTVWIDGQHQTRKVVTVEKGTNSTVTTSLEISAINQPVHVAIPPASQITAAPAGLGNL